MAKDKKVLSPTGFLKPVRKKLPTAAFLDFIFKTGVKKYAQFNFRAIVFFFRAIIHSFFCLFVDIRNTTINIMLIFETIIFNEI